MKRLIALIACLTFSCFVMGCGEKNESKREIKIETPGGSTTIEINKTEKENK